MSELSPKTRSLLRDARRELEPSCEARARVWSGLAGAGIPAAALAPRPASRPPPPGALTLAAAKPVTALLVAAALAGGAWMLSPRATRSPSTAARAAQSASNASERSTAPPDMQLARATTEPRATAHAPVVRAVASPIEQATTRRTAPRTPARATPSSPSALELELRLLRAATDALAAHQPALALRSLDRHARRFPRGVLREERDASRAIALCELGRLDEASRAETHVAAGSPYAARIARACTPREADSTHPDDGSSTRR